MHIKIHLLHAAVEHLYVGLWNCFHFTKHTAHHYILLLFFLYIKLQMLKDG